MTCAPEFFLLLAMRGTWRLQQINLNLIRVQGGHAIVTLHDTSVAQTNVVSLAWRAEVGHIELFALGL